MKRQLHMTTSIICLAAVIAVFDVTAEESDRAAAKASIAAIFLAEEGERMKRELSLQGIDPVGSEALMPGIADGVAECMVDALDTLLGDAGQEAIAQLAKAGNGADMAAAFERVESDEGLRQSGRKAVVEEYLLRCMTDLGTGLGIKSE